MKIFKKVNNFEGTKIEVPSIPKGKVVTFELPNVKKGLDGRLLIPTLVSIPSKDSIRCEKTGKVVDIAAIERVDASGMHMFDIALGKHTGGLLHLKSGNIEHEAIFGYLSLSNYNGSNENRDTTKPIIFERVVPGAKAKARRDAKREIRKAQNAVNELSLDQAKAVLASFGVSAQMMNSDDLYDELETRCETAASTVVKAIADVSSNGAVSGLADKALTEGIVVFDAKTGYLVLADGQKNLRKVTGTTRREQLAVLVKYLDTKAGAELLDLLRK